MSLRTLFITPAILASLAVAQPYTLKDLGALGGQSNAFAVSQAGIAAGTVTLSDSHFSPAIFNPDGPPTALAAPTTEREHVIFAFDSQNRPIGTAYTLGGMSPSGFRIDASGPTPLGPFAARAVNAQGDIAGTTTQVSSNGMTLPRACLYHAGSLTILPVLGGLTSQALSIDDLGRVVGSSTTTNEGASRPVLWLSPTRVVDLGTLGGAEGQATAVRCDPSTGISTVVGQSQLTTGVRHATRWTVNAAGAVTSRVDLGSLGSGVPSHASAINAASDVVGTSNFHAVLFRSGQVIDLNGELTAPAAGWVLQTAAAISDRGEIVGTGMYLGFPRAFLLSPFRCVADFNQDGGVDGADIESFFLAWEAGEVLADVNADGGVDGADVESFFLIWSSGSC
jgi:uncharacterized membrane protein